MKNNLCHLFSAFSWKKVINLKTFFIVPLLFSAAVHAETCPQVSDLKYNEDTRQYMSVVVDGISWISFDTYAGPVQGLRADYAEIRADQQTEEGRKGSGLATCHYSIYSNGQVKLNVDMYPTNNHKFPVNKKLSVKPVSATFKTFKPWINDEEVSQCQLHGNTSNCVFTIVESSSPVKESSASPFSNW